MSFAKLAESPFMKGADILTPITVTIEATRETTFRDPATNEEQTCAVLKFYDVEKELILNKTNLIHLLGELGKDERQWINREIVIRTIPMRNQSGQLARRIFVEVPQTVTNLSRREVPPASPQAPPADDVPTSWDVKQPAPPAPETEDQSLWEGNIPDPGAPMTGKRRKNAY